MSQARHLKLVTAVEAAVEPVDAAGSLGLGAATAAGAAALLTALAELFVARGAFDGPWGELARSAPALALAPAFLLACAAVHARTEAARKAWSLGALALAGLYATLTSGVEVTQLAVVIPSELGGEAAQVAGLALRPGGALAAIEGFGGVALGLSFALLAAALGPERLWLRRVLVWNAIFAPVAPFVHAPHALVPLGAVRLAGIAAALFGLARMFAEEG